MTREVETADVFAAAVPDGLDPSDEHQKQHLIEELTRIAERYVLRQWDGLPLDGRPQEIRDLVSEWLVTRDVEEIETFQPAHDCVACRAGNDQARAFLREHPGRWVALANLTYTEVWAS